MARDNRVGGFNCSWKGTAAEIRNTAACRQHWGVWWSHHWICSDGEGSVCLVPCAANPTAGCEGWTGARSQVPAPTAAGCGPHTATLSPCRWETARGRGGRGGVSFSKIQILQALKTFLGLLRVFTAQQQWCWKFRLLIQYITRGEMRKSNNFS